MKINILKVSQKKKMTLDDLKMLTEEEMEAQCSAVELSASEINNNTDLFLRCAKLKSISILCKDYETALVINDLINKGVVQRAVIYLLDDMELKDRSYIDTTIFKNVKLKIPNTYAMWGVKFDDKLEIYQYTGKNDVSSDSFSGYYDKETLSEIQRIASMIKDFPSTLTDVEKVILVSNYLQMYCQFIEGKISHVGEDTYILDDIPEDVIVNPATISKMELGDPKTALFHNFGLCRTFADATTLLLNNPYLRVNTRSVSSGGHAWNITEINGKTYQVDNSRAISRGQQRMEEALRATKFTSDYILFGENSLERLHHEKVNENLTVTPPRNSEDFDRKYIQTAIEYLEDTGLVNFNYGNEAFYKSHKVR